MRGWSSSSWVCLWILCVCVRTSDWTGYERERQERGRQHYLALLPSGKSYLDGGGDRATTRCPSIAMNSFTHLILSPDPFTNRQQTSKKITTVEKGKKGISFVCVQVFLFFFSCVCFAFLRSVVCFFMCRVFFLFLALCLLALCLFFLFSPPPSLPFLLSCQTLIHILQSFRFGF